jgi:hypothetical protein
VSCQTSDYTQLKTKQVLTICYGGNLAISYFYEEYDYLAYQVKSTQAIKVKHRKEHEQIKVDTFQGQNITWVVWEN